MRKTAIVIDLELMVNHYFHTKYAGEICWSKEHLEVGSDYVTLVIEDYEILEDPNRDISALHEVYIDH